MSRQTYAADGSAGAVVVDIGNVNTRVGYAGDDLPTLVYPSVIGAYHDSSGHWCCAVELDQLGWAQPELQVKRWQTVRSGDVEHDLLFQQLCEHGLLKLGAHPCETPLMLAEAATATAETRRRVVELAFEVLGVPALCVARSPELASIAAGRVTALVLEMGAFLSISSAVIDGVMQPRSVAQTKISSANLARLFEQQHFDGSKGARLEPACCMAGARPPPLGGAAGSCRPLPDAAAAVAAAPPRNGAPVAAYSEQLKRLRREELAREVFESLGAIKEKANGGEAKGGGAAAQQAAAAAEYTLPDGRVFSVGAERFRLPEYLFQGSNSDASGGQQQLPPLQTIACQTLQHVDEAAHKELLRNVVLTGGGSCLSGLPERLEAELRAAARGMHALQSVVSQAHRIALLAGSANERKHGAWLGGSILGSMRTQHDLWMSRAEYEEHGAALIQRKGMGMGMRSI